MVFPIYFFFIAVSFLASLAVFFRRKSAVYLRLFPLFLALTILVEIVAFRLVNRKGGTNTALYNFFGVVEFLFYLFVLHEVIHNKRAKRVIFCVSLAYLAWVSINFIFIQKINTFHTMDYAIGCLLIAAVCIYYFYELFQLSHSVNLVRQPAFWICSGLLFFYTCSFPLYGFLNFIKFAPTVIIRNLATILNILNVLLYSSFTIAFLCMIRIRKSTS